MEPDLSEKFNKELDLKLNKNVTGEEDENLIFKQ